MRGGLSITTFFSWVWTHPPPTAPRRQYNVLILLTDGCITGGNTPYLTDTIDSLVAAANSSLSVVIVGAF